MPHICKDPTLHYDALIRECVPPHEDYAGDLDDKSAQGDEASGEQNEVTSVELNPLVPTAGPAPFMPPPLMNASATAPPPSCGTGPKFLPQLTVLPRETPHSTVPPAPAEFPIAAVMVSFSVATVLWMAVLGVLLCRRRLSGKTGHKRSGRDWADELEKGSLAAHIDGIGHQVGCRDITVPPSTASVAIQCCCSDIGANHAFPLPAMDLGSAVLVTTKTSQCAVDTTLRDGIQ